MQKQVFSIHSSNYNSAYPSIEIYMSRVVRKPALCICENKAWINFGVTAKLISVFVFAIWIVQYLRFLNSNFQDSSHLLWLYSQVCVRAGLKPPRPVFSQRGIILWVLGKAFSSNQLLLQNICFIGNCKILSFNNCKYHLLLAHLSQRLIGDPCSSIGLSVRSRFQTSSFPTPHGQILCGASMGREKESLFAASGSHDKDGRHAHIW